MKKQIKKNKKQRVLFKQFELTQLVLKTISKNFKLPQQLRWEIRDNNFKLDINSSITRIKNRCILTGRSKSIYRFFKLSRLQLRLLASKSLLPGVNKYNW